MEHIYPAFERGRIMKKELLWALRDYSYSALQLRYQDYPDGIISGCRIKVRDDQLIVGTGIIKCQDFIFLLTEEEQVAYAPTEVFVSLKFRVKSAEEMPDYTRYVTEFVLDKNLERAQNELEICRFKLKEGARLRTEYKDFYDIQTEFDTVNLADATWVARGENTLSKEVTDYFAGKILECENPEGQDVQFAYFLLQSKEAVSSRVLDDYIARKTGDIRNEKIFSGEEIFWKLEEILGGIRRGMSARGTKRVPHDSRMIIMD